MRWLPVVVLSLLAGGCDGGGGGAGGGGGLEDLSDVSRGDVPADHVGDRVEETAPDTTGDLTDAAGDLPLQDLDVLTTTDAGDEAGEIGMDLVTEVEPELPAECPGGTHDGGDGVCVPLDQCSPGYFLPGGGAGDCQGDLVLGDPAGDGALPTAVWDGTATSVVWFSPASGGDGAWMRSRVTFDGQVLGEPELLATQVEAPGFPAAWSPGDGSLQVLWVQQAGLLRCMNVAMDGSVSSNTLSIAALPTPGEAGVAVAASGNGATAAWIDGEGTPRVALVAPDCQLSWGPTAVTPPEGQVAGGAPAVSGEGPLAVAGWPLSSGSPGLLVTSVSPAGMVGTHQHWTDVPPLPSLRLFSQSPGNGHWALTPTAPGGGAAALLLRTLDEDGLPVGEPLTALDAPPAAFAEPWSATLAEGVVTVAWTDPAAGTLWMAAFATGGGGGFAAVDAASQGAGTVLGLGPGALAAIPGVGHALAWSSDLDGHPRVRLAIVDGDGVRIR
ncbi:MAG: hypothetical protein FJ098_04675 [Deltaproteobacteria bacterium]|nr:hypothetical protein [Deltaproteobacteria bacterium]